MSDLEYSRQMRILDLERNHKIDIVDVWNGHLDYNHEANIDHNDWEWEDEETKTLTPDDEEYWFDEADDEDHMIPEPDTIDDNSQARSKNPYESLILSLSD